MLTKNLSILISAGVLIIGIAVLAGAEEKGKTIRSQEQARSTGQHEVLAKAGDPAEKDDGDQTMPQDRTRTQDRLRDGTGDHDPHQLRDQDRDQDHDRIYDHQGMGSGGMGGGGMGGSGMGRGDMRGPRR